MTERPLEGLLLVDKPCGPTSHQAVAALRRVTGQRRIGHSGTLDPMASGLLLLVLGRATRLVRFLPQSPKVYEGRIRLGVTTTSDDTTGEILTRHQGAWPEPAAVLAAAERFRGRFAQTPPVISARKVGGRRLYRLARAGRPVVAAPTEVEVFRLDLLATADPAEWTFTAAVSQGTYLRALARDLGEALGTGGALGALRRVAIGSLTVADAVAVPVQGEGADEIVGRIVPTDAMPLTPPPFRLRTLEEVRRFTSGTALELDEPAPGDGRYRFTDGTGALLGIGSVSGRRVRPEVVVGGQTL